VPGGIGGESNKFIGPVNLPTEETPRNTDMMQPTQCDCPATAGLLSRRLQEDLGDYRAHSVQAARAVLIAAMIPAIPH